MDTTQGLSAMATKDLCVAAAAATVAHIDARITENLRKRARTHGLTDREADALAVAWKWAANETRLPDDRRPHAG